MFHNVIYQSCAILAKYTVDHKYIMLYNTHMKITTADDQDRVYINIDDQGYASDDMVCALETLFNQHHIRFETVYTGEMSEYVVIQSAFEQPAFQKDFVWFCLRWSDSTAE